MQQVHVEHLAKTSQEKCSKHEQERTADQEALYYFGEDVGSDAIASTSRPGSIAAGLGVHAQSLLVEKRNSRTSKILRKALSHVCCTSYADGRASGNQDGFEVWSVQYEAKLLSLRASL